MIQSKSLPAEDPEKLSAVERLNAGVIGLLIILPLTHTAPSLMSLMGVLMLIGIANSNRILIGDFARKREDRDLPAANHLVYGRKDHHAPQVS
jgi:multidrug efflux pump subunit AcrB